MQSAIFCDRELEKTKKEKNEIDGNEMAILLFIFQSDFKRLFKQKKNELRKPNLVFRFF